MRFLVVGSPVHHSLSPAMMTAAFRAAGLEATYEAREIRPSRWPAALAELHAEGIAGANVTVPHKRGALDGAVAATAVAQEIGASNTLIRRDDGWLADNTDGPGFIDWVRSLHLEEAARREVLLLGAGGSARAVLWALRQMGAERVRVANRTVDRAREMVASVGGEGGATRITVESLERPAVPVAGLIMNCTSLGLRPDDVSPMGEADLSAAAAVLDLVYPDPPLVRAARRAGVFAADGRDLLVAQGALSLERWTGRSPDRVRMKEAIEAERARRRESGTPGAPPKE